VSIDNFLETDEYDWFDKQYSITVFIHVVFLFWFRNVTNSNKEVSERNKD